MHSNCICFNNVIQIKIISDCIFYFLADIGKYLKFWFKNNFLPGIKIHVYKDLDQMMGRD